MNRSTLFGAAALFAVLPALAVVACDDKKAPPAPPPSAEAPVAAPAASPSAAPSDSVALATPAPSSSADTDSDEPDDNEQQACTSDLTSENFEKELEALDKEVSSKY
jgi:hypothetical protein